MTSTTAPAQAGLRRPAGRRRPEPDEHAEREERRRADRDELPVDVDQRVEHERAGAQGESRRRGALGRLDPADGRHRRRRTCPDQPEQQEEPDHPGLGQELEREVVRLGGDDRSVSDRSPGDLESRRPVAPGRSVLEELPRLLPPPPSVARAEVGEAVRRLGHLRRFRAAELVEDRPSLARDDHRDGDDADHRDDDGQRPRQRPPPFRSHLGSGREVGEQADDSRAEAEQDAEPGAVVHAVGVGLQIVGQRGSRERPERHEPGDRRDEDERSQRLEAVAVDHQPGERSHTGNGDSRTRVGEDDDELGEVDEERSGGARHGVDRREQAAHRPNGTAVAATSASEFQ